MAGKSDYFFNNLLNGVEHDTFSDYTASDNSCQLNIDSEAVDVIITFCYTGAAELTIDNVENVLIGAKKLKIESLSVLCDEMFGELLDLTNCIRFLEIADKYEINILKENALAIISDELPHINRLPEFYHLNGSQMFWLIELLSTSQNGIFDDLLKSLDDAENVFPAHLLTATDTHAAIRAAVSHLTELILLLLLRQFIGSVDSILVKESDFVFIFSVYRRLFSRLNL